jgi:hypothetical protein
LVLVLLPRSTNSCFIQLLKRRGCPSLFFIESKETIRRAYKVLKSRNGQDNLVSMNVVAREGHGLRVGIVEEGLEPGQKLAQRFAGQVADGGVVLESESMGTEALLRAEIAASLELGFPVGERIDTEGRQPGGGSEAGISVLRALGAGLAVVTQRTVAGSTAYFQL